MRNIQNSNIRSRQKSSTTLCIHQYRQRRQDGVIQRPDELIDFPCQNYCTQYC